MTCNVMHVSTVKVARLPIWEILKIPDVRNRGSKQAYTKPLALRALAFFLASTFFCQDKGETL